MTKILLSLAFIFFLAANTNSMAKSKYVSQTPNGSKFNCVTCHISSSNFGLNKFGSETDKHIKSGNFNWNAALAALDSDGDGYSNGQELQDPNGTWNTGNPTPGIQSEVSNPGDSKSIPPPNGIFETALEQNMLIYPNPFKDNVTLILNFNHPVKVKVYMISLGGKSEVIIPQMELTENNNKIDLSKYFQLPLFCEPGAYYIIVETPLKSIIGKIIKY